ncbi:MAG: nicotinamide-nucleotide amidohydrolase family protein [Acutalibacteraceae bacterium]|nr:nicotinamide-nucleotide amidohydrolase family protein [Acutalibacteraceae bacterium]
MINHIPENIIQVVTEEGFLKELEENCIEFSNINKLLVKALTEKNMKIATAESCTGGLISKSITEVSGSSAVFDCGVCSYSNDIKSKVLSVDKNTLDTLGAVSAETAMQMAKGVRLLSGSDMAISTTGIAGPTGGTDTKPVGLVYIGLSTPAKKIAVKALLSQNKANTRARVRELAAACAMYLAYKEISENVNNPQ